MKILLYFLTFVFGLFGILAVLRMIERTVSGAGLLPAQFLVAIVGLLLAVICFKKARGAPPQPK